MKPATHNLTIYQGSTFVLQMQWKAGDAPVNLNGYGIRSHGRKQFSSTDTLFALDLSSGITITNEAEGRFELRIEAQETAAMSFSTGVWDLEAVYPSGDVHRIVMGSLTLSKEVTR